MFVELTCGDDEVGLQVFTCVVLRLSSTETETFPENAVVIVLCERVGTSVVVVVFVVIEVVVFCVVVDVVVVCCVVVLSR